VAEQVKVELTSWSSFPTPNLAVAPELLGRSHVFTLEGLVVTIALPTARSLPDYDTPGQYAMGERLGVSTWGPGSDGQLQPLYIDVHEVDVTISIPGRTSVPDRVRTESITHEFFSGGP
jgi:hypothetical protein